jgi:transposase
MFEALGLTEVIDKATQQDPAMRSVTAGHAVKAMVLNGLGCINQQRYLVPHFFQNKPLSRLIAPGIQASPLNDDPLGRALDTLYDYGVTALYSLIAATAVKRRGLAPRFAHLDSTRLHVAGRSNSAEEPEEHVMHLTRGYSREQRPDLNHVRRAWRVAPHAGMPVLMKPLSGKRSDTHDCGQIITDHRTQWQLTYGTTGLVAARALYSAENLQKLAEPRTKGITRVPATLRAAQAVLAQAAPQTRTPLTEGDRYPVVRSSYGGVEQRWGLIHSAPRQPQAPRTVDKQLLKHSEQAVKAFKQLCRTAFAWEADAPQALATLAPSVQATFVAQSTVHPTPRSAQQGRPGQGTHPDQIGSQLKGALAMRIATRQAHLDQPSCCLLATNALDDTLLPPQELFAGSKGQALAERGVRFLKAPQFLASTLSLTKPERIMALLMVRTVCLLVYAALEERMRPTLKAHEAIFPDQKGKPIQHPTARWVFHSFVGMPVVYVPQQGPIVLNLTEEHQHLRPLLGNRYAWLSR